ncbi:LysR family transcriptional regulator [Microbispora sp. ATCC PTA-5024]|nr:LysR family transcriptional regulator [Microbispora sp. ATCC PTA-5024]
MLMDVDPHLLRTFVTVVREGSFSAAADRLGYTQPAVSQQIAALEADLGVPLLLRRPVRPTRAGERLLEHAGPLLLRLRAARADVARVVAESQVVTVAASPLAVTPATAAALARAAAGPAPEGSADSPAAAGTVTVRTADAGAAVALAASGEADLALVDGPAAPSDPLALPDVGPLTSSGVGEEPLVVVLPEGHPLTGRPGLRLDALADALWVDAPGVLPLDRLRAVARIDGFRTGMRYEGHDVATLARLAAAGHGLALLPRSAAACGAVVPLAWPRLVHRIEVLHGSLPDGPARRVVHALTAR